MLSDNDSYLTCLRFVEINKTIKPKLHCTEVVFEKAFLKIFVCRQHYH